MQRATGRSEASPRELEKARIMVLSQNDGSRESESVTYEVSRIIAKTLTSPGEIRRLSVAVVLNAAARPAAGESKPAREATPRSAEDLEKIRTVVMTAVGFSEA